MDAITVGMGATIHYYSDSQACTVVAISKSGKRITLRADKAKLLNGANSGEPDALEFSPGGFCGHTSGHQRWAYEPDPNGSEHDFSLRTLPNGATRWVRVGESLRGGTTASLKGRFHHYDFNF